MMEKSSKITEITPRMQFIRKEFVDVCRAVGWSAAGNGGFRFWQKAFSHFHRNHRFTAAFTRRQTSKHMQTPR